VILQYFVVYSITAGFALLRIVHTKTRRTNIIKCWSSH